MAPVFFAAPAPCAGVGWTYKGVCWDADWENRAEAWYGGELAGKQLKRLAEMGVNAISVTPFAHQADVHRPEITFRDREDSGLAADVARAKALGLRVVYKPHLWSRQFGDGSGHWHGTIEMLNESDWDAWFGNYERMIVHHAAIAEKLGADAFVIGLEYVKTTTHDDEWRRVIAAVRKVYRGKLTYAAHDLKEADRIRFWDALDYIGINAYFPIAEGPKTDPAALRAAWRRHAADLEALSKDKGGKPVLLTEVGYSSVDGAAREPFKWWPRGSRVDLAEQADSFDAMLGALRGKPWLAGVFIWKFKIGVTPAESSREASEAYFVFQDKPAEAVIRRHFKETP